MDNIIKSILQGKYDIAENFCKNRDDNSIKDMLMAIAYETESICVYSFIQYMIKQTERIFWIKLAVDIMINPLCFIEGAYSVALFHSRELLIKERSVENLERIIFFYNIPEKLIDKEEVECISAEILKKEPNNEVALSVIKYIDKNN